RALARSRKGDRAGARADCDRAIELDPRGVPSWRARARIRAEEGDFEGAIADFGRVIELAPGSAVAWCERASARGKKGDAAGARDRVARLVGRRAAPPLRHPAAAGECPFPISGGPQYLAGLTIGGPVADHGSHAGVKAAVRAAGEGTGRDLLEIAHFTAFGI